MKNYFLQADVPNEFPEQFGPSGNKFASVSEEITPLDLPYFMIKHERAASVHGFDPRVGLSDVDKPMNIELLKVADMSNYQGAKERMLAELQFLYVMGLAVIRGTTYYILPQALALFYEPTNGFFAKFNPNALLSDKQSVLKPVVDHMYEYLLPGRWWRALYGSLGLSPAVQPEGALQREMLEIETVFETPIRRL